MNNKLLTTTLIIAGTLALAGCTRERPVKSEDTRIVAMINNYKLTAGDLKNECDPQIMKRYFRKDPEAIKQDALDAIIMRKILLQEAQKEGLDKDRAFMDAIERHWESTLIKLLMAKKENELLTEAGITDSRKMTPEEQKKLQAKMGSWISGLKKNSRIRVNEKIFNEVNIDSPAKPGNDM